MNVDHLSGNNKDNEQYEKCKRCDFHLFIRLDETSCKIWNNIKYLCLKLKCLLVVLKLKVRPYFKEAHLTTDASQDS